MTTHTHTDKYELCSSYNKFPIVTKVGTLTGKAKALLARKIKEFIVVLEVGCILRGQSV